MSRNVHPLPRQHVLQRMERLALAVVRNPRIKVMDQVVFHRHRRPIAQPRLEDAGVVIAPALLRVGDRVKFRALSPEEFAAWK